MAEPSQHPAVILFDGECNLCLSGRRDRCRTAGAEDGERFLVLHNGRVPFPFTASRRFSA
jgi:predicted DCC family thiol-disulfide oxidoreductase YuxK